MHFRGKFPGMKPEKKHCDGKTWTMSEKSVLYTSGVENKLPDQCHINVTDIFNCIATGN